LDVVCTGAVLVVVDGSVGAETHNDWSGSPLFVF